MKICVSNPAVLDQFIHNAQASLKKNPELAAISASPNDSAWDGHCMCEGCKAWDAWAKAAPRLLLRPNLLHFGHGYPLCYPNRLGKTIRHCAEAGMVGVDFDSLMHHWANQGVNYYVLAKLLWDPKADVDLLVDDYCNSGFGKAAPAIRQYFDVMGQYTRRVGATATAARTVDNAMEILPLHTPELFASFEAPLDKGRKLAAGDPEVLERIAFLEKGVQYMRLHSRALRLVSQDAGKSLSKPAAEAVAARQKFYDEVKHSFAVGVADIVFRDSKDFSLYRGFSRKEGARALPAKEGKGEE